jgi:hypothetical protein
MTPRERRSNTAPPGMTIARALALMEAADVGKAGVAGRNRPDRAAVAAGLASHALVAVSIQRKSGAAVSIATELDETDSRVALWLVREGYLEADVLKHLTTDTWGPGATMHVLPFRLTAQGKAWLRRQQALRPIGGAS